MDLSTTLTIAFIALALERFLGFPSPVRRLIGHPANWLYSFTGIFTSVLPGPGRTTHRSAISGAICSIACIFAAGLLALALAQSMYRLPYSWFWQALVAAPFLAQYGLRTQLRAVYGHLERNDISRAMKSLEPLHATHEVTANENAVSAAAIRGMAANTCAGVITPTIWLAIFGLPGLAVVATVASLQRRLRGREPANKAADMLNIVLNYVPARLCALLFSAASSLTSPSSTARALERLWYGRKIGGSINRRWPEAAVGGILNVRLTNSNGTTDSPANQLDTTAGLQPPSAKDLKRGMRLLAQTLTLFTIVIGILAAFI